MPSFVAVVSDGEFSERFTFGSEEDREHFLADVRALQAKWESTIEKLMKIVTGTHAKCSFVSGTNEKKLHLGTWLDQAERFMAGWGTHLTPKIIHWPIHFVQEMLGRPKTIFGSPPFVLVAAV